MMNDEKKERIEYDSRIVTNFIKKEFPGAISAYRDGDRSFRVNSIFIEDDRRHLYIFAKGGGYRCFKSGNYGPFEKLVRIVKNLGRISDERVRQYILKNYHRVTTSEVRDMVDRIKENSYDRPERRVLKRIELPKGIFFLNKKTELSKKFFEYLYGRGLTDKHIKKFRFCYAVSGKYENRVILPVFDKSRLVYFTSRDITDLKKSLKYLHPHIDEVGGNGTGMILFNYDFVNKDDTVVVCEGPFNCLMDVNNSDTKLVAVFGKTILQGQLKKLEAKEVGKIVLAYDNDKYFKNSTIRSINFIKNNTNIPVEVIDWSRYPDVEKNGTMKRPGDFGDLMPHIKALDIYSVSHFDFLKKQFLGD